MDQYIPQEEVRRIIISDMVKIVPLWLSYWILKWIRSAFEEDSKVMRRYMLLTNIGSLAHEASLLTNGTYVHRLMNIGSISKFYNR